MPEHQTIEYKESWHDEFLEWICGYANAYGGTLYITGTIKIFTMIADKGWVLVYNNLNVLQVIF